MLYYTEKIKGGVVDVWGISIEGNTNGIRVLLDIYDNSI